jgi:hypothetical protein
MEISFNHLGRFDRTNLHNSNPKVNFNLLNFLFPNHFDHLDFYFPDFLDHVGLRFDFFTLNFTNHLYFGSLNLLDRDQYFPYCFNLSCYFLLF